MVMIQFADVVFYKTLTQISIDFQNHQSLNWFNNFVKLPPIFNDIDKQHPQKCTFWQHEMFFPWSEGYIVYLVWLKCVFGIFVVSSTIFWIFSNYVLNSYFTILIEFMQNVYSNLNKTLQSFKTSKSIYLIFMQFCITSREQESQGNADISSMHPFLEMRIFCNCAFKICTF